ncbi:MAG TPA: asparagine synthase (glutamine-hydrolyzing) [Blastocatellia bacterium]
MCGICGIVSRAPTKYQKTVARMQDALTHRGPDGEGEFVAEHVHLAMRRLSIIDLAGGWQPLYNEDRSLALLANGEIYNYVELREELEARGHQFNTQGDCEAILHLYEEYGLDCVKHLRGMFAFALWDKDRQKLMLARDRMGEKPLYLFEQAGSLIFASELKALLRSGQVPFKFDPVAVNDYFHYGYVPEPKTPLAGVRKLPAGHWLTIDTQAWRIEEHCYWHMEDAPALDGDPGLLIREELETISKIVIRSDVPVGVALSGGLDSSAITALAARQYPGTMHAFSVGYHNQPRNDERADAQMLADYLKIPFHEVELRTEDLVEFFPRLVYWQDDPIADIAGYGYYAVMKLAREHNIPVMLQGHGGDELFWGYGWSRRAVAESRRKAELQKKTSVSPLDYLQLELPESRTRMGMFRWAQSVAGLRSSLRSYRRDQMNSPEQIVFYDLLPDFALAQREAEGIYAPEFIDKLNGANAAELFTLKQPWPQLDLLITRLLCQTYLLENGVAQGDRLSMASSVELRLPLLDYRLAEIVTGLRKCKRDDSLPPKTWLKAALKGVLPDWVLNRPKRGFTPPVRVWHRALFAAYGENLIDGELVRAGVLSSEGARELAQGEFPLGVTAPLSFKALVLEMWSRSLAE